jgi:hypothetical protein
MAGWDEAEGPCWLGPALHRVDDEMQALLEALHKLRRMCDPNMSHQEALMVRIIDSAIAKAEGQA